MMPRQLREGLRRHPKGSRAPRLIIEQLPSIQTTHLHIPAMYNRTHVVDLSFKIPQVTSAKVCCSSVEFYHRPMHRGTIGPTQIFKLKPIRTGFGVRHTFLCMCGRSVQTLYYHARQLACRHCLHAIPLSQTLGRATRPLLQISRLEALLGKKGYHRYSRVRERLEKKFGAKVMLAKALR